MSNIQRPTDIRTSTNRKNLDNRTKTNGLPAQIVCRSAAKLLVRNAIYKSFVLLRGETTTFSPRHTVRGEKVFLLGFIMDVRAIVQTLKKELRDYSLRKRKHIDKPRPYRLPLVHRKCTLKQLQAKYPEPWSYSFAQLLKLTFARGFAGRTYGSQSSRPSRRSRH